MDFKKILMVTQKEEYLYPFLSIFAPVAIALYISPQDFPENGLLLTIFIIFYILIFNFIYRIYLDCKNKIRKNVIGKLAPSFFEKKKEIIIIKSKLEDVKGKSFSKKNNTNNTSIISDIINRDFYSMSLKYGSLIKATENLEQKINDIDKIQGTEKINWVHYKKFDYLLMFTASLILILKFVPVSLPLSIEPINSVSFIFLFFIVIVIYTFWAYIKYYYYLQLLNIFCFSIPRIKYILDKQIEKNQTD